MHAMLLDGWPWKPQPDYERLLRVLRRQGDPAYVPPLEFLADPEIIAAVLGEGPIAKETTLADPRAMTASLDQAIRFWHALGYDAFRAKAVLDLPLNPRAGEDTALLPRPTRSWMDEKKGLVTCWEDFERYPWPRADEADYRPLEYVNQHLPEGMAVFAKSYGIFEQAMFLMGFETLAYSLYDQPDLVEAIFAKIEEIYMPFNHALAEMDGVIGLWMGDDMGFRSGTMIHPDHLRQYVLPRQERVAALCHEHGILFLLHSCGNLDRVYEDLIDNVRIDAKHSFEDAILPVEKFSESFSHRVAVIGGVDVDLLARGNEPQVRARTRQILEACAPSGAFALGSGNSITNYVPVANFLAMLDECHRFNAGS